MTPRSYGLSDQTTIMFIPFIDILYSLAIGTGFVYFPINPLENVPGTVIFLFTLFVAAQDWHEYHDKVDVISKEKLLFYHIWQIFVVLALNQMFRFSAEPSLIPWLAYFGIFAILNAIWNAFTIFLNHWLFVITAVLLATGNFAAVFFYSVLVSAVPDIDSRWIIFLGELLLVGIILILVRLFNKY